ncbi:MAG TPA: alpha/beta hydrolase [Polyangiales bacterium]|nr:alpha/beta hydrolase [Polyangiales bacterium]
MSDPIVHTSQVRSPDGEPTRALLFLHGILGTGPNLRGLAQAFVRADPSLAIQLVDLRLHGKSRAFAPPHDVRACARDLVALESTLALPVIGVLGHSFGGKVALAYHAERPDLTRVITLDSDPGSRPDRVGSEQTTAVLEMLDRAPRLYARRDDFIELVHAEGHSRAVADWLAMNLERRADGFHLQIDLPGINALLDSYFASDLWSVLEQSHAQVEIVVGGRSQVWDRAHLARVAALAANKPSLRVHVLPEAGHWVHVDDPSGLRAALIDQTETP